MKPYTFILVFFALSLSSCANSQINKNIDSYDNSSFKKVLIPEKLISKIRTHNNYDSVVNEINKGVFSIILDNLVKYYEEYLRLQPNAKDAKKFYRAKKEKKTF